MFDESMLPDVTLGEDEPAMAKVLLVVSILGAMALLILYGVLFPGSDIPALGTWYRFSVVWPTAESGFS
ncbi:MAG: hypothetical protein Ct9H90mP16_08900 [Candidatus Poseidoniales archaeon]|nr:MAG: hypothetical protein Ct9H90mP16_08900 [Candidatus Poseidoniales archaeon]